MRGKNHIPPVPSAIFRPSGKVTQLSRNCCWCFPISLASSSAKEGSDMPSASELDKYFSLVEGRECGECMVCCQCLSIDTACFKKPADVLCSNCIINEGCSIYETRPSVCRTWHCLWRRWKAMPDEMRPDKSKVVFSLKVSFEPRHIFENAYIVCMSLSDPSVFDTPLVSATIDAFVQESILPVWLSYGGCKSLIWPDEEMASTLTSPCSSKPSHMRVRASKWLHRYNSLIEPLQDRHSSFGSTFVHKSMS